MQTIVGWICAAVMVGLMASCTYGVALVDIRTRADLQQACWALGGAWEDGWGGKWCNRHLETK